MTMIRNILLTLTILLAANAALAGATSQTGKIIDHSSIRGGLLIRFDTAVAPMPGNCVGAHNTWLYIPETSKTIMAVALMALATGNRVMSVYTSGVAANGLCEVSQLDPEN